MENMENRNVKLSFRMTKEEDKKIKKFLKKTNLSLSDFIRICINDKLNKTNIEITNIEVWKQKDNIIRSMSYIGNNINQIAKMLNTYKDLSKTNLTYTQRKDLELIGEIVDSWNGLIKDIYDN